MGSRMREELNYSCFAALTRTFLEVGWPHPGMVLVQPSLSNDSFAGIAAALLDYDRQRPQGLPSYQVDCLRPGLTP